MKKVSGPDANRGKCARLYVCTCVIVLIKASVIGKNLTGSAVRPGVAVCVILNACAMLTSAYKDKRLREREREKQAARQKSPRKHSKREKKPQRLFSL